jgi:ribonuclease P protein component
MTQVPTSAFDIEHRGDRDHKGTERKTTSFEFSSLCPLWSLWPLCQRCGVHGEWYDSAMEARRYRFLQKHRLRTPAQYAAVYDARVREVRGPLVVFALPNALGHPRLGLSVSRKVGVAVKRNRIRRLLREAFRHMQHDLPRGYDWVVVVRPHEPLMLAEYQKLMTGIVIKLHNAWKRRIPEQATPEPSPAAPDTTG